MCFTIRILALIFVFFDENCLNFYRAAETNSDESEESSDEASSSGDEEPVFSDEVNQKNQFSNGVKENDEAVDKMEVEGIKEDLKI